MFQIFNLNCVFSLNCFTIFSDFCVNIVNFVVGKTWISMTRFIFLNVIYNVCVLHMILMKNSYFKYLFIWLLRFIYSGFYNPHLVLKFVQIKIKRRKTSIKYHKLQCTTPLFIDRHTLFY